VRLTCFAFALFAVAFCLHLLWWRVRMPRRHTAVLLALFFGTLTAGLVLVDYLPELRAFRLEGWLQRLHVAEFFTSMTLAYVVAYSAIEERSPSMTLLVHVAASGDRGRTEDELYAVLAGITPIETRLRAMVRDHMIELHGDVYCITFKGRLWAMVFGFWRRLSRLNKGG
jgi:hypothetical protein